MGGWAAMLAELQANYNSCAARTVADVDLDMSVLWLGGAEMQISIDVTNNEAETYNGNLKIYITEIESRYTNSQGE